MVLKDFGVKFVKVDVIVYSELVEEYGVDGYFILVFFVDGEKKFYIGGWSRLDYV